MKAYDIERYVNGELQGDELQDFESLLNVDLELRDEVNRSRVLLEHLKQLHISVKIKKAQQENRKLKKWRHIILFGIFSLGILLLFHYFNLESDSGVNQPNKGPLKNLKPESKNKLIDPDSSTRELKIPSEHSPKKDHIQTKNPPITKTNKGKSELNYEEIAMNYYSTPEEFAYLRSMASKTTMDSAKMAFNNENFKLTMTLLNSLQSSESDVKYFKAHVLFKMQQYGQANVHFAKCLKDEKSRLKRDEIEWYLILNDIACGNQCFPDLKHTFKIITRNSGHSYYKVTKDLEKMLKLN